MGQHQPGHLVVTIPLSAALIETGKYREEI